ncbi:glycoside hydrolase family 2 protein [Plantibacter sp. VKM Ac-2880]|uniref:glycoside hydrolase family 2 protein n=1 Tax=Plantibacter sp. VKM Ac-2880 TaxID=2783827 RepID=UPI00189079B4|nr:glycoside hydrolase family 2 protein [Plantibacter sp. VKM Ac-2880]MBF4569989.1 glycoside hydrolase family 2 protein [Plantibacter sp. VKM Ac-2880]
MAHFPLHSAWTVTAVSGPVPDDVRDRRIPATVPGCAHLDLLAAGLIADPFDADNEAAQQWIGDTVWRYETTFDWQDDGSDRHDLVAEGLDTVATIEVNGTVVGHTENQHRSHRFDVGALLVAGANRLTIMFAAPVPEAEARSAAHGPRPHVNHHPYNALRKAAFNFGWDWGVDAATSGVWRPIGIESWSGVRIASVRPLVDLGPVPAEAAGDQAGRVGLLDAHIALEWAAGASGPVYVGVSVGDVVERVEVDAGATEVALALTVPRVEPWWPIGHGTQSLYDVEVVLEPTADGGPGSTTQPWRSRVGFRTVSVDTTPDEHGSPFDLVVNGELIQIRGANWIPDHTFVTEVDRARYRRRVADAVDANMNLLRVWGGGIYESDDFYDACDEAGVLVWQDFLFACAAYAEEDWLAAEVEVEAREAITRLSPHPSLVVWNGNNENIWGYVEWGWRPLLAGRTWGEGYYRELFPALLAELDPTRPYSPASPFSFSDYLHPNDASNGTMHIWDVWNLLDYREYRRHEPRFASEFGFQGPPAWSTLTGVVHDEPLEPCGAEMLVHQKAEDGNLKLERGLRGHLPEPRSIGEWHWATQLNQAAAIRFGIEHFRSLALRNTGAIVWQLNDSWPVVSWAAVDFAEHRKPLWYALRAVYEPRLATFQPSGTGTGLALVLLNDDADGWDGEVLLRRTTLDGAVLATAAVPSSVEARGVARIEVPVGVAAIVDPAREILTATLDGFATAVHAPAEVVDQALDPRPLTAEASAAEDDPSTYLVTVVATSYARDVTLLVDRVDPAASVDRGLVTLLAGERATFRVRARQGLDPQAFLADDVLRHANGLLAGR